MQYKARILMVAVLLSGTFLCAQTANASKKGSKEASSDSMVTVEEVYLNSMEGMMIKEMIAAEGYDSKLVALQYIEEALENGRSSDDIQAGLDALATTGVSTVIRENGRVTNNYPDIRRKACELLGTVGNEAAKDTLIAVMYADNEPSVISAAVKSLGTIGMNENDEVSDMINWIARKFDTINPTSSLALEILNTFEKMGNTVKDKRNMFETIMRIANNYAYVTPVRTRALEVMNNLSNAE